MVVAGGYNKGDYLDTTEIYYYNSDDLWKTLETIEAKLPTPRMVTGGMVGGGDYIYLFGKYIYRENILHQISLILCLFQGDLLKGLQIIMKCLHTERTMMNGIILLICQHQTMDLLFQKWILKTFRHGVKTFEAPFQPHLLFQIYPKTRVQLHKNKRIKSHIAVLLHQNTIIYIE